jgi:hypothetical protein
MCMCNTLQFCGKKIQNFCVIQKMWTGCGGSRSNSFCPLLRRQENIREKTMINQALGDSNTRFFAALFTTLYVRAALPYHEWEFSIQMQMFLFRRPRENQQKDRNGHSFFSFSEFGRKIYEHPENCQVHSRFSSGDSRQTKWEREQKKIGNLYFFSLQSKRGAPAATSRAFVTGLLDNKIDGPNNKRPHLKLILDAATHAVDRTTFD